MSTEDLTDRQVVSALNAASTRLRVPVDLEGVLDRVDVEIRRPERGRWRRFAVAALALLVAATGVLVAWRLLDRGRAISPPAAETTDHFLRLADPPLEAGHPAHLVRFETNLPEGTLVDKYAFATEIEGGSCCDTVREGMLKVGLANNNCHRRDGELHGSIWELRLTAAPLIPSHAISCPANAGSGCPPPPTPQPASVYRVLGERFEHLRGPQVVVDDDQRRLVTTVTVEFPPETCVANPSIGGESAKYPRGAFARCPNLSETLPVGPDVAADAEAAALAVRGAGGWAVRMSAPAKKDILVIYGCGKAAAVRSWMVVLYPLAQPDSASLPVQIYLVRRAGGWEAWGSY